MPHCGLLDPRAKQVVGRLCASCQLRLLVPVLLPLALAAVPVGMVLVVAFLVVVPPFALIGQGMLAYAWTFNKARSTSEPLLLSGFVQVNHHTGTFCTCHPGTLQYPV